MGSLSPDAIPCAPIQHRNVNGGCRCPRQQYDPSWQLSKLSVLSCHTGCCSALLYVTLSNWHPRMIVIKSISGYNNGLPYKWLRQVSSFCYSSQNFPSLMTHNFWNNVGKYSKVFVFWYVMLPFILGNIFVLENFSRQMIISSISLFYKLCLAVL